MHYSSRNNSSPVDSSKVVRIRTDNTPRNSIIVQHSRSAHSISQRGDIAVSRPSGPPLHSLPIRLPRAHIHRTPSELQLAQELLKADYVERQMYARLVLGMSANSENSKRMMHPLTAKSLRGVVDTHNQEGSNDISEEDDWEVCYQEIENTQWTSSVDSNYDEDDDCLFHLEM
eukprot:scaffold19546_cov65-Cyclotella_meneghiniana.AAC.7